jgi:cyclic pyranopterin phosphate synthase
MTVPLEDSFGRQHTYLRISVTDRCNYRCVYCMPSEGLSWVPREDILSYEEITRIVNIMAPMGIRKVRISGGEPTLRADLITLIGCIAEIPGIDDIAMTTNGHTLARLAPDLARAGLKRINVSIDAMDPAIFKKLTRGGDLNRVLDGIEAARTAGITPIKLNAVILEGENEDQIEPLIEYAATHADDTVLRFIEYMPFEERRFKSVKAATLRARLQQHHTLEPLGLNGPLAGPAQRMRLRESGLEVGFISPLSEHFCATCNRLRLMANGHLRTCLAHEDTPSLRDLLRAGVSDQALATQIRQMVLGKPVGHDCQIDGGTLFEGVMTAIGG